MGAGRRADLLLGCGLWGDVELVPYTFSVVPDAAKSRPSKRLLSPLRGGGPGGELGRERGALLAHEGSHVLFVLDRLHVRVLGAEARRAHAAQAGGHLVRLGLGLGLGWGWGSGSGSG